MQDGPWEWDSELVYPHVVKHIKELASKGIEVGTIVTFDEWGISHHPNHIAVYHACKKMYDESVFPQIDMYTLYTISMLRKYDFFIDIFLSRSE